MTMRCVRTDLNSAKIRKTLSISLSSVKRLITSFATSRASSKVDAAFAGQADVFGSDVRVAPAEKIASLAADCHPLDLFVRVLL